MTASRAAPHVFTWQQITQIRRTFKGTFIVLLTQAQWKRLVGRTRIQKVAKFPAGGLEVTPLPGAAGLAAVPRCPPGETPYVRPGGRVVCLSPSEPNRPPRGPCSKEVSLPALCLGKCSTGTCRFTIQRDVFGHFWFGCVCR